MLRCDWLLNQTFIAQSEYRNHLFESRILIGQCVTRDLNLKLGWSISRVDNLENGYKPTHSSYMVWVKYGFQVES